MERGIQIDRKDGWSTAGVLKKGWRRTVLASLVSILLL